MLALLLQSEMQIKSMHANCQDCCHIISTYIACTQIKKNSLGSLLCPNIYPAHIYV